MEACWRLQGWQGGPRLGGVVRDCSAVRQPVSLVVGVLHVGLSWPSLVGKSVFL